MGGRREEGWGEGERRDGEKGRERRCGGEGEQESGTHFLFLRAGRYLDMLGSLWERGGMVFVCAYVPHGVSSRRCG